MGAPRKSIPLTGSDRAVLSAYVEVGTPEHTALERLAGGPLTSEAAALRALALLGLERVQESLLETGYTELARGRTPEDAQATAALRAGLTRRVADGG